jgi:hypothetical protein
MNNPNNKFNRNRKNRPKQELSIVRRNPTFNALSAANQLFETQTMKHEKADTFRKMNKLKGAAVKEIKEGYSVQFANWAKAYSDPWSVKSVSMPAMPLLLHQQVRTKQSGLFFTNANGNGTIMVVPAQCATNNSGNAVVASSMLSGDVFPTFGLGTNLAFSMQGPYDEAAYALGTETGLQFRIAALGLRIRYLGTVLNAAGTGYSIEVEPKNNTPTGGIVGYGITDIKNNPTWKEFSVMNGEWHGITRQFLSMKDLDYQGFDSAEGVFSYAELNNATASISSLDNTANLGIYIAATPNQKFEFEVACHLEVVGQNLPQRTKAHYEQEKVLKLNDAYRNVRVQDNITPDNSMGKRPDESGGWLDILGQAAIKLAPLAIEAISTLF